MDDRDLEAYFAEKEWSIAFREERAAKTGEYFSSTNLPLSQYSRKTLEGLDQGIYRHQLASIER